uniref:Neuferricin n=1 Tax=Ciona savignyi TaxID=51511 RepID=H2ZQI2_CIOSA
MGCLRISVIVLIVAVGCGWYFGPNIHQHIPNETLTKIEKFIPKKIMDIMHGFKTEEAAPPKSKDSASKKAEPKRIFSKEELWKDYRGEEGSKGLYLAFFGKVFDVSKGKDHYGPGGGYHFFAGRDGTKGFVTGDFSDEGLTDDIDGVDTNLFLGFDEWTSFYASTYTYVGTVIGHFYDENGKPTVALKKAKQLIADAKQNKKKQDEENKIFPMCNSESSAAKGSRVWCSTKSGGIERSWVGVPRLYHPPGAKSPRCACVRNSGIPSSGSDNGKNRGDLDNPYMREYEDCHPTTDSCVISKPK